jgi:membrane-bound serine protease (ClpP class)
VDATIITLLIVGVLLLLAETVLPGLIAGILGLCCLIAAIVIGFVEHGPAVGLRLTFGVVVGLVIGTVLWFRFFPDSRLAKAFVSTREIGEVGAERPELLHQTGVALTTLRPSGTALINGSRVDVVTEGGLIERGSAVKVVAVEGMRTVVRAV